MPRKNILFVIVLQVLAIAAVLVALYLSRLYSFVLMHTLAEMFSIIVGCSIFMIAWNTRRFQTNNYILFIGISFLFVGIFDLLHTLAYKGLNVFNGFDANLATQLWIAARYTGSTALLIAPLLMGRRLKPGIIFGAYSLLTVLVIAMVFFWRIFPDCYIEGKGLTPFKVASEYIISAFFAAALMLLYRKRREFERSVLLLLAASIVLRIASELVFTLYIGVYDVPNMAGHFFKVAAFYLFYKALVEASLARPYEILFRNLKKSEEALRAERDRVQNYLDVARTVLVVVSADQRVSLINRMGCQVLGYSEEEIVGRNWFSHFVPAAVREDVRAAFNKLIAGEILPVEYFENPIVTRGGEERIIAWHNAVLRDEQGRITATLSSGEDISGRRMMEEVLAERTRDLVRSNTDLNQFAAIVSHDLKEPLLTISGFADLVREQYGERMDAKGREHLERIIDGAGRMDRLISDLLAYSRVASGSREFTTVPLTAAVDAAVSLLRAAVDGCGAVITKDALPVVRGDETQLVELFQNLIGNAVKYRGRRRPRVHITAKPAGASAVMAAERSGWLISVADNGIGIDPLHQDRIFGLFERVHTTGVHDGTGVGLAVCKKIVERHGGRIWVESEPGSGTTFHFTIR